MKRFGGRQLGLLVVALLLSGCRLASTPNRDFSLVIPVYDEAGLEAVLTLLKPHLSTSDRFMIVSGNTSGAVDTVWVNEAARRLHAAYPSAPLYAATSGLTNVAVAAREVTTLVAAIVYVYEPNFPNQPEFSWDFTATLDRFGEARAHIARGGFQAIGKPTGRPLLQTSLDSYNWNYGALAETVDELFVQTQTYCKESPGEFAAALDTLAKQYGSRAALFPWTPQITIDPGAPNGTTVAQAQACVVKARERGLSGAVLWWSPTFVEQAVAFIVALNETLGVQGSF